jgi:RNA-directed DNA polymerase
MRKLEVLNIKDVEHLCKHLRCGQEELGRFCAHPERYYRQFSMDVRGKKRPIATPLGRFCEILYCLKSLLCRIALPLWIQGGVKGCSPRTNASCHINKPAVLNFDIEDFFPSVRPYLVYNLFCRRLGCSPDVSRILTRLTTLNGGLPQGSPTSTVVANLTILPLAKRMKSLADKHDCDYGQFVDDGNVSGPAYIENLRHLIDRIIQQERFRASPKPHKRVTRYWFDEQVVTGVKVNRGIDVRSEKLQEVKDKLSDLRLKVESDQNLTAREIASVKGKIQSIAMLNATKANCFRTRLMRILKLAS